MSSFFERDPRHNARSRRAVLCAAYQRHMRSSVDVFAPGASRAEMSMAPGRNACPGARDRATSTARRSLMPTRSRLPTRTSSKHGTRSSQAMPVAPTRKAPVDVCSTPALACLRAFAQRHEQPGQRQPEQEQTAAKRAPAGELRSVRCESTSVSSMSVRTPSSRLVVPHASARTRLNWVLSPTIVSFATAASDTVALRSTIAPSPSTTRGPTCARDITMQSTPSSTGGCTIASSASRAPREHHTPGACSAAWIMMPGAPPDSAAQPS